MRTSVRVTIICHLTLLFWYLAWVAIKPPLEEFYHYKTIEILCQAVNEPLPESTGLSLSGHIGRTLYLWVSGIPPFAKGWVAFSLAICLLLLFSIRGARQAVWLLPLLSLLYGWDNIQHGLPPRHSPDATLFPTELELEAYVAEPLSKSLGTQIEQLRAAWQVYLQDVWGGEEAFNKARLAAYLDAPPSNPVALIREREPPPLLAIYLIWNLFFAFWTSFKS